jgi:hypothetical protein
VGLSGVLMRETIAARVSHLLDLAKSSVGVAEVSFQPFQEEISGPDKDLQALLAAAHAQGADRARSSRHPQRSIRQGPRGVSIFTESMFGVVPDYLATGKRPIPPGGCFLPSKFLLVDFRGDVYPCFFMRTDADRMGNVLTPTRSPISGTRSTTSSSRCSRSPSAAPGASPPAPTSTASSAREAEVVYAPAKGHWVAGAADAGTETGRV